MHLPASSPQPTPSTWLATEVARQAELAKARDLVSNGLLPGTPWSP